MNRWSADLLEYELLRALVRRSVASPMGRARLDEMAPSTDRAALEETLADIGQAMDFLRDAAEPPRFGGIPEIDAALAKLRIEGAVLDPLEILGLVTLLERAAEIRRALLAERARYERLALHADAIDDFNDLLRALSGKILPGGVIADDASPALARLRRDKKRQTKAIEDSLDRFVRAHRDDGMLQESFVTLRNDRFVVPLVVSQRGKVSGVVHGTSSSGQTAFVEPLETIELNNELVRLSDEELREIHRILREMTARLHGERAAISAAVLALGELDLVFGKAQFGREFGCVVPVFGERLHLQHARHPLLIDVFRRQRKSVVPLTLTLDGHQRTLLISGPNTGGKTVAMKCVGLIALMAQSGLPVPAEEAELPVFDQVLADIGDQQSIAESLSSFSAHVVRLRDMQEAVTPDSLVLLDELGRATDPDEGGALAVALLEDFRLVGAFTLVSTHLMAVKVYGSTAGGTVNASMGFNEETLEPTYVLKVGVPGKSAGLDIASRLGLPPRLIEKARERMGRNERDIARFLNELNEKVDAAARRELELAQAQAALKAREAKLEQDLAKREAQRVRELEARFEETLAKFQNEANRTIQEIGEKRTAEKARLKSARLEREFSEQVEQIITPASSTPKPAGPALKEGARVRLKGIREPGRIRRLIGADVIEVEAGFLKVQVPRADVVEVLDEQEAAAKLPKNVRFQAASVPSWSLAQRELNVIGKHAQDALDEVDKFLDSASLASCERVRIVHGHGMGVLKRAIAEMLRKHPHVEKFQEATPAEGGAGATIVELR